MANRSWRLTGKQKFLMFPEQTPYLPFFLSFLLMWCVCVCVCYVYLAVLLCAPVSVQSLEQDAECSVLSAIILCLVAWRQGLTKSEACHFC